MVWLGTFLFYYFIVPSTGTDPFTKLSQSYYQDLRTFSATVYPIIHTIVFSSWFPVLLVVLLYAVYRLTEEQSARVDFFIHIAFMGGLGITGGLFTYVGFRIWQPPL